MVPKGWNKSTLSEIGKWSGGGTPSKAIDAYWTNGTIPWVSPKDMKLKYLSDAEDYITEEAVSNSSTKLYPAGSVLLVTRSGILRKEVPVAIALCPVAVNQDLKVFNPNEKVNSEFLANFLWCYNQRLLSYCAKDGTTVESIDTTALMAFPIVLPPLPEQRKIAQILSTWDKVIATTERLLTNRQQQKKALMQRLLTGKQRFAGFEEEWEEVNLDKLCSKITDGAHFSPQSVISDGFPIFSVKDMSSNGLVTETARLISPDDYEVLARQNCQPQVGDVLIAKDGSILKHCFVLKNEVKGVILSSIAILRSKIHIILPDYLMYFFRLDYVKEYVARAFTTGSGVPRIVLKDFKQIKVLFPKSIDEQRKIAAFLSTADAEITTIQNQLDNLKQQKKALMQQLLTGKRRVKVDSPALATQ